MATIVLTGTGPGLRALLTVRGGEAIGAASIVAYDASVAPALLALAAPAAHLLELPADFDGAVAALDAAASSPGVLVRLVAGDVMTSPRHAAEAEALAARGHRLEIIPGVPVEYAAASFAGVSPGNAGHLELVRIGGAPQETARLSVHLAPDAASGAEALLAAGHEPVARVLHVRSPGSASQVVADSTLGEVAGSAHTAPGGPASVTEALVLAHDPAGARLPWFERKPLFGRRIVVTRPRAQAAGLIGWLEAQGAEAVPFPAIRIAPPPDPSPLEHAAAHVGAFDWIVFTSVNGVERFWSALEATGCDSRALAGARVVAIGPATAAELAGRGIRADLVPPRYVAESVLEAMARSGDLAGKRVLLPRAAGARAILPDQLRALGADVVEVEAYRSVADTGPGAELAARIRGGEIDALTFTSSSTVKHFVEAVGTELGDVVVACIGPVTADTARAVGMQVSVVAPEHTVAGLTSALADYFEAMQA